MTSLKQDDKRWKALAVLSISYLMVVLDVSIVNVALSHIALDLEVAQADLQWVITGYALTFGGFMLLGGRIGDLIGRKRLFMLGIALFALFSLMCGLATSPEMLIVARILQGAAAAMLAPSVFSIVAVTFAEGAERNKALGILGAVAGSGAAIGVILGGVLTEKVDWRWCFWINVPIAAITLFFTWRLVRESRADSTHRHFDASGAVLITSSLMILVYALTRASEDGWLETTTLGLIAVSLVLAAAFVVVEMRTAHPLVPMTFFRRRVPTGANVIGFLLGMIVQGIFLLLSLYMQFVLHYEPIKTGVAYLAIAVTSIVAAGAAQALVSRIGVRSVLAVGMVCLAAGLLLLTRISVDTAYASGLLPGFLLIGVGLGFSFVPVSIAALAGVPGYEAGLASGLINTNQQIGGALGVAVLASVATTVTGPVNFASMTADDRANLTDGYAVGLFVAAGFAVLALVALFTLLRGDALKNAGQDATVVHGM